MKKEVILLSGGLDSAANLVMSARRGHPVLALTCDYGQRAGLREIESARNLAEHYGVKHEVVQIPWLGALGGSALTEFKTEVPILESNQLDELETIQRTARAVWVPNRNGVLIQLGAAYAERIGADRVVVGFNREEATTFPDNSIEFLKRSSQALDLSTANHVEVYSYTAELDKAQIVKEILKVDLGFPFQSVWSCYLGGESPCGQCESCKRFLRATQGVSK